MSEYYESAQGELIHRLAAHKLLGDHGVIGDNLLAFDDDVKPNSDGMYLTTDVLDWIGYCYAEDITIVENKPFKDLCNQIGGVLSNV